jgi:hypothetical protein
LRHIVKCVGKHLSDSFPIENGLIHGDAITHLHFNFASEVPGKPDGTENESDTSASGLRWWCEPLLIDASKEVGL